MTKEKQPHEKMTEKNNGLTDTQEVLYQKEFKKADHASQTNQSKERS